MRVKVSPDHLAAVVRHSVAFEIRGARQRSESNEMRKRTGKKGRETSILNLRSTERTAATCQTSPPNARETLRRMKSRS